jgi:NTE family protein
VPQTLNEVQERVKDIQFQSKARLSIDEMRAIEALRSTVASVIKRLPAKLRSDPQVKKLEEISHRGRLSVIHLVNRHDTGSLDFKDYEFSRATVEDLWQGGHRDVLRVLTNPDSCEISEVGNGVRIFDLPS